MPSYIIADTNDIELPKNISSRKSNFNPLQEFANTLKEGIAKSIGSTQYSDVLDSAAYIAFLESLYEFLKNSVDKNATYFRVCVYYKTGTAQVEIVVRDLNTLTASSSANEPEINYNWAQALKAPSPKELEARKNIGANETKKCTQHHLALAQTAFFLQQHSGTLSTRTNRFGGFDLVLKSPSKHCAAHMRDNHRRYYHDLNSVDMMILSIFWESIEKNIINAKTVTQLNQELQLIKILLRRTIKNPSETVQASVLTITNLIDYIASDPKTTIVAIPKLDHPSVNEIFKTPKGKTIFWAEKASRRNLLLAEQNAFSDCEFLHKLLEKIQEKYTGIRQESKKYPVTSAGFYAPKENATVTQLSPEKSSTSPTKNQHKKPLRNMPLNTPPTTPVM